jgi:hypothetical protein
MGDLRGEDDQTLSCLEEGDLLGWDHLEISSYYSLREAEDEDL